MIDVAGRRVGLSICEDVWSQDLIDGRRLYDLDPLDYRSFAEVVLVNGKTVYEKDKVSFFNHIQTDRSKGLKGRWWDER